jgi:hypothetical protein
VDRQLPHTRWRSLGTVAGAAETTSEEATIEGSETNRDVWDSPRGGIDTADALVGLCPELCPVLYASGILGISHDSGLEERDSDSHRASHARIGGHDLCYASEAQSGAADRPE